MFKFFEKLLSFNREESIKMIKDRFPLIDVDFDSMEDKEIKRFIMIMFR